MFDEQTLREELAAIERRLQKGERDRSLINMAVTYARQLRKLEHDRDGFVTARNSITGY